MDVTTAALLVLDDEAANVRFLLRLLEREGYTRVRGLTDPRAALASLREEPADLLLLDLHMPQPDGFAVLSELRAIPGCEQLPVLVLTGDASRESRNRALRGGARDFVAKPFDGDEVLLRIRNLLLTHLMRLQLEHQNEELEARVRQRTFELEQAQVEILMRLATAAEHHDEDTSEHTRRVAQLTGEIALALGLELEQASLIAHASLLHDVGKMAVPVEIMRKPGPLTTEQWAIMKRHTGEGSKLLRGSRFRVLQQAEEIARTHHERWDGTGYPAGLADEAIPLAGRIVAAADVYDALVSVRPYKPARSPEAALEEIRRISGSHLDPRVVRALEQVLEARTSGEDWPGAAYLRASISATRPAYLDVQ